MVTRAAGPKKTTRGRREPRSGSGGASAAEPGLIVIDQPRSSPPSNAVAVQEMAPLVLVVDDDSSVRIGLARLLRAEGFEVATEADGRGALESVRLLRPDVVLLDIVMPEVTGFEVCRSLKAEPDPADPQVRRPGSSECMSSPSTEYLSFRGRICRNSSRRI